MAKPKPKKPPEVAEVTTDDADHKVIRRQTTLLVDDYNRTYQKLELIQGQLRAHQALLEALSVENRMGESPVSLLAEIAEALVVAHRAAHPLQGRALDPNRVTHSRTPPDPGSSTRAARRAQRELHRHLRDGILTYDAARQRDFHPDPDAPPRVRCRSSNCPAADDRVSAWKQVRGGRRIYAEKCRSCGGPLVA